MAKFNALLVEYKKAPEATRKRLYLESLMEILPQAGSKIVVDPTVPNLIPMVNQIGKESQQVQTNK